LLGLNYDEAEFMTDQQRDQWVQDKLFQRTLFDRCDVAEANARWEQYKTLDSDEKLAILGTQDLRYVDENEHSRQVDAVDPRHFSFTKTSFWDGGPQLAITTETLTDDEKQATTQLKLSASGIVVYKREEHTEGKPGAVVSSTDSLTEFFDVDSDK